MARTERSAGVVLFRIDPKAAGHRRFLLLDYGRHWDYPKGHVEKGEDDAAAALRELGEETGIADAEVIPGFAKETIYFFRDRAGRLIRKEVIFFLARTSRKRIRLSHEHSGVKWLAYEEALEKLTYPNAKAVLKEANSFLDREKLSQAKRSADAK